MPIRFQYDAAAVVPPSSNELKKYGGQMLMQQRKYDLDQMRDQRNNQMRMQNIAAMQNYNAEPSIGEDDAMLEQEIRSGAYDPDTVRSLRDDQRAMRQIMRDRNIDGTQRAQALDNLRSRMRMMRSTGRVQPMMQTQPSTPRQPPTAAQAFAQNDKLEERFMGMIEPVNPDGTPMPYEERLKKAMEMYDTRQRMLFGQPAQQPAPPVGQSQASYSGGSTEAGFGVSPVMAQGGFQGMGQSAYQPTGNYTGGEPVFGVQPVLAQQAGQPQATQTAPVAAPPVSPEASPSKKGARGYISAAPRGGSVTELGRNPVYSQDGKFLGDTGLYDQQGADYIRRQAAGVQPMAQPVSTERAGFDAAMGSNLDTAYDLANMDRSPGTNFFNPENPAYAAMRAPAPQQSTGNVGQFKGRYGLGGVDYGINPATGNRVTASIRPGGGLEFDEPVGKPGTAMGGRKGSVTIMGGTKKPAAGAEVSPGESTPSQMEVYNALPTASEIAEAEAIAVNPNTSAEQQKKAAMTLKKAGRSESDVRKLIASGGKPSDQSASGRPAGVDVQKAYDIVKGNRSHDRAGYKYPEFANAEKVLKGEGWTDQDISDLRTGVSKKKLPDRPTQSDKQKMLDYLQNGNPSDVEREVIEKILEDEGVDLNATSAPPPQQATASPSTTAPSRGVMLNQTPSLPIQLKEADKVSSVTDSDQPEYKPSSEGEIRTWTNKEGKKLEGSIVEGSLEAAANQPDGQRVITIKRSDGKFFNIPIDQFSEEDLAYLDAKYKLNLPPANVDSSSGKDFLSRYEEGKAYKYEKPKKTDRKYNTGEKPGPRSKQYQTPGPFQDSIPVEFWNPKPPSEAYRKRMS